MLAWIELGTAFVILGIVLISLFQALRRCRSNNNIWCTSRNGTSWREYGRQLWRRSSCLIILMVATNSFCYMFVLRTLFLSLVFIFLLCVCVNDFVLVLGFYPSFCCAKMWRMEPPICLQGVTVRKSYCPRCIFLFIINCMMLISHNLMLIMVTLFYVFVYFSFNLFIFGFITFFLHGLRCLTVLKFPTRNERLRERKERLVTYLNKM